MNYLAYIIPVFCIYVVIGVFVGSYYYDPDFAKRYDQEPSHVVLGIVWPFTLFMMLVIFPICKLLWKWKVWQTLGIIIKWTTIWFWYPLVLSANYGKKLREEKAE